MKFLCVVYAEPSAFEALSESEQRDLDRDSIAYDKELEKSGHYIASNALRPVDTATTVRVRKGKVSMTDGPFAETKEHLCGFILIEAEDLDDALRVAQGIPMARIGSIEVRPVMELEA